MIEIKIIGRGGMGAVTASQILAKAAFFDGKYAQAFPNFGIERSGAPVFSFVRIDDKPINLREQIYNPDYVIVLDSSLFNVLDIKGKEMLVNSSKKIKNAKTVDVTKIAMETFGRPIVNTAILGAFAKITELVSIASLCKAVEETFDGDLVEKNKEVMRKVYEKS